MPFLSPKRKVSDAENKLRILLCLDALGMASQEELWPMVARLELMEYLPFCVLLDELRHDGAVAVGSHALEGVLYLTAMGRQQLSLFGEKIVHADRERILEAGPAYREELRSRKQVRTAYELSQNGRYRAALTLREGDVPTLFLRLSTADQSLVEKAVHGFAGYAPQVLNLLYTLDIPPRNDPQPKAISQEAAVAAALPGQPMLCAFGGVEHAAVACVENDDVRYTLLLLLPTAETAWAWAQSADAQGETLAFALTALLGAAEASDP